MVLYLFCLGFAVTLELFQNLEKLQFFCLILSLPSFWDYSYVCVRLISKALIIFFRLDVCCSVSELEKLDNTGSNLFIPMHLLWLLLHCT